MAEVSQPSSHRLSNGLRYTILPLKAEKGRLEIRMKVYAGSVDEEDHQAGVAHMVEHLAFRSTEKHPNGLMPFLHENKWVRGRNYNAVTTNDSTTYMLTPPANMGLDESLSVLSQLLFYAKLTQNDLESERKIIVEEWRAGQGVGRRMDRLRTNSVRVDSRYTRHPVIGTLESIQTMPVTELQQFYQKWYAPNNMQLLIVGDVEVAETQRLIEQYFGDIKEKPLPVRDYYEPQLSHTLRTTQLQDAQSGVSQIAYILRFDESPLREQSEVARYRRLVDRLALEIVAMRLRNESEELPQGIRSLVFRKSDIGKTTVAIGIFAGVDETSHQQGLKRILTEIERLSRFPITQAELARQKEKVQAQIEQAKKHKNERDFSGWIEAMLSTVMSDKPYLPQAEIAYLIEPMLHKITLEEVNSHIQQWFLAQDKIVQYQAPRLIQIEKITPELVSQLHTEVRQNEIAPPRQEKIIQPMVLEPLSVQGKIIEEKYFPEQNVHYFYLSNGDKVVWLKSPLAKERSYFEARSAAGFQADSLVNWQSQLASQLVVQNGPKEWTSEQLNRWKELKKVNLSLKQTERELIFSGQVDNDKLSEMLHLYYAFQQQTQIKEGIDEVKTSISRTFELAEKNTPENLRRKALTLLRYGVESLDTVPEKAALEQLSYQDLNQQWQKITASPVTYYLMNDMTEESIKQLITMYLSAIPRSTALVNSAHLMIEGRKSDYFAMNLEPKDNVQIWSFTPQKWQGKNAVLVSLLENIASQKLKLSLRDEYLGVYSVKFNSRLNPESHRIETELSFVSNPTMTDKLIKQAEIVLQNLPEQITEEDVQDAKWAFLRAEEKRQELPYSWMIRLVLSDKQFNSPRYLSEIGQLVEGISLKNLKRLATQLYNTENSKIFITTPIQPQKVPE